MRLPGWWRKIFPKYECRKCKDTFVLEGSGYISRCDCPASQAAIQRTAQEFGEFVRKVGIENMHKYIPD